MLLLQWKVLQISKVLKKINLNEKIFVAGGSGMAGNSIVKNLKKKGYGKIENGGVILYPTRKELDLSKIDLVNEWFEVNKPTVVIIAAAKVGGIIANFENPATFILENLKIQNNLIETSWKFGVKRLLFLGSSCIYPKYSEQPIKEEYLLKGELEKTNEYYALAKISGIKLCESLRKQYEFDAISLMPTNLYGPGDNYHPRNSHVIAALLKKFIEAKKMNLKKVTCWGTGKPRREFMHVDDLANAVIFALEHWDTFSSNSPKDEKGEVLTYLNVGTGSDITIKQLAEKIAIIVNYKSQIYWDNSKPDGTKRKLLDIKRINKLGWKATIGLEEGLKRTADELLQKY